MANKIKGLLFEVNDIMFTLHKVEFEDTLHNLYDLVKCELVEMPIRYINGVPYTFIVDEEGLLKTGNIVSGISNDTREILVGNILIVKGDSDSEGNLQGLEQSDYDRIMKQAIDYDHGVIRYDFE